jgi:hypothetical protein
VLTAAARGYAPVRNVIVRPPIWRAVLGTIGPCGPPPVALIVLADAW